MIDNSFKCNLFSACVFPKESKAPTLLVAFLQLVTKSPTLLIVYFFVVLSKVIHSLFAFKEAI